MSKHKEKTAPIPAALWCGPGQASLFEQVVRLAGLSPRIVGAADPPQARALSERFEAEWTDDLRQTLHTPETRIAIVGGDSGEYERAALADAELLLRCAEAGMMVISMSPFPDSLRAAADMRARVSSGAGESAPRFAPLFRRGVAFRAAADVFETFGPATLLGLTARSGAGEGGLGARLYDAMDASLHLLGEPELIDASVRGPRSRGGLYLTAADSLAQLRGHMSAHLRYADGRSATLTLSDHAGHWFRGATVLGEDGCLRIDEAGFEWISPAGEVIDGSRDRDESSPDDHGAAAARAIADDITRLLSPGAAPAGPGDPVRTLAMCEAALLSCRTGQAESPATILKMTGAV